MDLTRRIDLVGYLHIGYGALLLLIAVLMFLLLTVGALILPQVAAWLAGTGATIGVAGVLLLIALPSMIAGVGVIRRASWARMVLILLSAIDLFSFPFGTALGIFSLYILLKDRAVAEFA